MENKKKKPANRSVRSSYYLDHAIGFIAKKRFKGEVKLSKRSTILVNNLICNLIGDIAMKSSEIARLTGNTTLSKHHAEAVIIGKFGDKKSASSILDQANEYVWNKNNKLKKKTETKEVDA